MATITLIVTRNEEEEEEATNEFIFNAVDAVLLYL